MPRTARQCADELEGIWDAADREGRELTPAERAHVEQLIESAKSQHSIEKGIREIGLQLGPGGGGQVVWPDGSGVRGGSPGERLAFSATDEPVKKIATSITISDELLSDAPAVQTFVNGQLSLFVQIEAERQLCVAPGAATRSRAS